MDTKHIFRNTASLALCVLLTFVALCVWDSALILGDHFGISHVWFDMLTVILFLGAVLCSCMSTKEGRR